ATASRVVRQVMRLSTAAAAIDCKARQLLGDDRPLYSAASQGPGPFARMPDLYDVAAIGNALVDVITASTEDFLRDQDLPKCGMTLIDEARAGELYEAMPPGVETS